MSHELMGHCLVVEISGQKLRCLENRPEGRFWRKKASLSWREEAISDEKDACGTIRKVWRASRPPTIFVVPRKKVILKRLLVPSRTDEEIRKMLRLQIPQWGPYTREEMTFDYLTVSETSDGWSDVLVVLAPLENMRSMCDAAGRLDADLTYTALSSQGLANWFSQAQPLNTDVAMLIDLDGHDSEICFVVNSKLLFSRPLDLTGFDGDEKSCGEIISQAGKSLELYRKENMGAEVAGIFLLGTMSVPELSAKLQTVFNLPVKILSKPSTATAAVPAYFLGLINGDHQKIDLFSEDFRRRNNEKARRKLIRGIAGLALLTGLITFLPLAARIYHAQYELQELRLKLKAIKPRLAEVQKSAAVDKFLDGIYKENILVPELFRQLYDMTPPGAYFSSIRKEASGSLAIEGAAQQASDVYALQNNLAESQRFSDTELVYVTEREDPENRYVEFKISCGMLKPEDQR